MKKLKDLVAQKRKAIEDKKEIKRAKLCDGPDNGSLERKVSLFRKVWQVPQIPSITLVIRFAMQHNGENRDKLSSDVGFDTLPTSDAPLAAPARQHSVLPDGEVRRRLRRLGHPITLFGETESNRHDRYRHVERTFEVTDEGAIGGESANVLLTIQKEDRLKAKEAAMQSGNAAEDGKATPPAQQGNGSGVEEVRTQPCFMRLAWSNRNP